jgi:DNA-binding NarL/FixJ family response regulator
MTMRNWVRTRPAAPSGREPLAGSRGPVAELPGSGLESQARRGPEKARGKPNDPVALTPREREVLDVLGRGLTSSREIAAELVISQGTANLHVKRLLHKLGFVSRVELARWWATHAVAPTAAAPAPRSAG